MTARILIAIVGVLMAVNGIGWLIDPTGTALGLGMPLLEGMGRSTQIGDMAAFFNGIAGFCFYAAWKQEAQWANAAAILLILTALFRAFAWAVYDAELATTFITLEFVMASTLFVSAAKFKLNDEPVLN